MADRVMCGPSDTAGSCGTTLNIHTNKIMDACRDKDCIEELRVYPTVSSQAIIDSAFSVRPVSAQLLYADVNVDEISFNRGHYTVDVTFFYLVSGETFPGCVPVRGLSVFEKRVILCGGEGSVRTFSSRNCGITSGCGTITNPIAYVDAVDPIALNLRIGEATSCEEPELRNIPEEIIELIGEELNLTGSGKKLYATLGQFTIIRLERDYQISINGAESFLPDKECVGSSDDDPCTLFSRVSFPVEEFYPSDTACCVESYRDLI